MKIDKNSELHRKLISALESRIKAGLNATDKQIGRFNRCDEIFTAYIPTKDMEELASGKDKEAPTINIPYSYAVALTAHTYITSTFLGRSPIIQVTGRKGEATGAERAMEALLDYQIQAGDNLVPLYNWTLDPLKYGIGILGLYWADETSTVDVEREVPAIVGDIIIPDVVQKVTQKMKLAGFQGCKAYNLRPHDWGFDNRVPLARFQEGEFVVRRTDISLLDILDTLEYDADSNIVYAEEDDNQYFNIEYLPSYNYYIGGTGISQLNLPTAADRSDVDDGKTQSGLINCFEIYVRLIPKLWKLGTGSTSEKWVFLVTSDYSTIISARPLGHINNKFPFEVLTYETTSSQTFGASLLEVIEPLNSIVSWLFNSHLHSVRQNINGSFVVDPSLLNMRDFTRRAPGRLIRARPEAYGRDVRTAIHQLTVTDPTQNNLNDMRHVLDMIQRVTGINDSIMGMASSTNRKTATEIRSSTSFGVNRLKTLVEYMSAMGFSPLAGQMISLTQQFYNEEEVYRVVGQSAFDDAKTLSITPEMIAGEFSFTPVDGTLPVDRFAQVNLWQTMMGQVMQFPAIANTYDFSKIFAFVAELAGLKNIAQFKIQVSPDALLQQQAAAGNQIPIGEASANIPQMGQIPGMGGNNGG